MLLSTPSKAKNRLREEDKNCVSKAIMKCKHEKVYDSRKIFNFLLPFHSLHKELFGIFQHDVTSIFTIKCPLVNPRLD